MRVLAATDLSARSDRAIDRAVLLAAGTKGELTILHVIDDELPERVKNFQAKAAKTNLEGFSAAHASGHDRDARRAVTFGKDWAEILKRAQTEDSDLIVLGVHREGLLEELFVGTTVERVIRNGDRPVLVVKEQARNPYERVVVGVDFSVGSRHAIEFALRIAPGATVFVVHAYDIPFRGFLMGASGNTSEKLRDEMRAAVDHEMEVFLSTLGPLARNLRVVICEGMPDIMLRQKIAELRGDLLVVGTHGRTGIAHALVGSVAERMLTEPPCDVIAVKGL